MGGRKCRTKKWKKRVAKKRKEEIRQRKSVGKTRRTKELEEEGIQQDHHQLHEFLCSVFFCPSIPQEGVFLMTQNRALQLLFDLRYLNTTLGSRLEEGKSSRSNQEPRYESSNPVHYEFVTCSQFGCVVSKAGVPPWQSRNLLQGTRKLQAMYNTHQGSLQVYFYVPSPWYMVCGTLCHHAGGFDSIDTSF